MRKRSRDRHDKGNEGYEQGLEDDQEEEQEEEEQEKWTSYARADDWIDALVFVTDEISKRNGGDRRVQDFMDAFVGKVTVTRSFVKGVTHIVTTLKWLASNRGVEHLFAIAEIKSVRCMVSFEWVCACVDQGRLVSTQSYSLALPLEFRKARDAKVPLFAGNLFYFSGEFDASSSASSGNKASHHRGNILGLGRLAVEKRDLILLAALQGGQVVDILNRDNLLLGPNDLYRGYSVQDLQERMVRAPSGRSIVRVIVSSQDTVSLLGIEVFADAKMRPLLAQWLIQAIQSQEMELAGNRFEVFGVAK